jgi:hypothetical protein
MGLRSGKMGNRSTYGARIGGGVNPEKRGFSKMVFYGLVMGFFRTFSWAGPEIFPGKSLKKCKEKIRKKFLAGSAIAIKIFHAKSGNFFVPDSRVSSRPNPGETGHRYTMCKVIILQKNQIYRSITLPIIPGNHSSHGNNVLILKLTSGVLNT